MQATFGTMDEVLLQVLRALVYRGSAVSPRGDDTREMLGYTFRLSDPRARRIGLPARKWSESLAVGEFCWHLSASDSVDFITYYAPAWERFSEDGNRIESSCYGRYIFGDGIRDQWSRVLRVLSHDPRTRRAVITLSDTQADLEAAKDVACMTSIQFLVRNDRLHCITTMRSCDVIWGLCYDVFLTTMLQELIAVKLGLPLGWYQHSCGSIHLYDRLLPMAEQIIADGPMSAADPMPPMDACDAIPAFLRAEAALRENCDDAEDLVTALPAYWRSLAVPLERLNARRWARAAR